MVFSFAAESMRDRMLSRPRVLATQISGAYYYGIFYFWLSHFSLNSFSLNRGQGRAP